MNIAKTIREHSKNSIQTSIRTGKYDFLLRKRSRGDSTPWAEIPPIEIHQEIPEFEIGTYRDIINPENNVHEDKEEVKQMEEEESEELEAIIKDLSRDQNKRDRTRTEESPRGRRKTPRKRSFNNLNDDTPEASGEEESEEENSAGKILNSTPIETIPQGKVKNK